MARLRRLRVTRGLSQEQLARLLGVSFATVNRWETGGRRCPRGPARRSPMTSNAAGKTAIVNDQELKSFTKG